MLIDVTHCNNMHDTDQDSETLPNDCNQRIIRHLTKEKCIVLLAAE